MFTCPRCAFLKNLQLVSKSYPLRRNIHTPRSLYSVQQRLRPGLVEIFPSRRNLSDAATARTTTTTTTTTTDASTTSNLTVPLESREQSPQPPSSPIPPSVQPELLPLCCPGCGAYAQTIDPNEPGYYSKTRRQTRRALQEAQRVLAEQRKEAMKEAKEAEAEASSEGAEKPSRPPKPIFDEVALEENPELAEKATKIVAATAPPTQVCDRCHDLIHHNKGVPAPTPTIESIRALLEESPHSKNRVYHVIDAADFPASLITGIYHALDLQYQRSKNRRAKTEKYKHGKRMTTISFVITRADLLAPTKEKADSLMQRVRRILLDRLHLDPEDVRLGNIHMISSHRGWWTKKVKEEIREHGGGIWVVGKANVGKSSFITTCFPKDSRNLEKVAELLAQRQQEPELPSTQESPELDTDSLLPPAPREELFPTLPVVSSLPGTTVSPIRIPFGRGRGEMIDLPGLERGNLHDFVKDEHKRDLIMTKRMKPKQLTIKPRQSLLLGGGLVQITPRRPPSLEGPEGETQSDLENKDDAEPPTVLAANFTPLEAHVTRTEKAIEILRGERTYNTGGGGRGTQVIRPDKLHTVASAGIVTLSTDVTRNHLPRRMQKELEDHGTPPPPLPYRVFATDILIEGVGWVELTAQVRVRRLVPDLNDPTALGETEEERRRHLPHVEVSSPYGQHIQTRPPLETYRFIEEKKRRDKRKLSLESGSHRPQRQSISIKKRAAHGGKV